MVLKVDGEGPIHAAGTGNLTASLGHKDAAQRDGLDLRPRG